MLKKFDRIQSFEDVEKHLRDLRENISLQDLRAGDVRTEAPTTETLEKTRYAIVEEAGVPSIYYRSSDGVIHKLQMTAV